MTNKPTWHERMVAKYGSEEAVKQEMRRRQELSMLNPNRQKGKHKGGFSYMKPEEHRELSKQAINKRWSNYHAAQANKEDYNPQKENVAQENSSDT